MAETNEKIYREITNEKLNEYRILDFFYSGMKPEHRKNMGFTKEEQEMLTHIDHCHDLQKQAQDKAHAEMWKNFWGQ